MEVGDGDGIMIGRAAAAAVVGVGSDNTEGIFAFHDETKLFSLNDLLLSHSLSLANKLTRSLSSI